MRTGAQPVGEHGEYGAVPGRRGGDDPFVAEVVAGFSDRLAGAQVVRGEIRRADSEGGLCVDVAQVDEVLEPDVVAVEVPGQEVLRRQP